MRRLYRPCAAVIASVALTIAVEPNPAAAQHGVYKSGVELVPLTVNVTDRTGRYVPDLTASDFAIFEEGRPQVVSQFAAGHVPVDVGFLIDTSGSMQGRPPLVQKAACGLVRQLREGDRGAMGGIGSTVVLHESMTPDLARVDAALRSTQCRWQDGTLRCCVHRLAPAPAGALLRSQASISSSPAIPPSIGSFQRVRDQFVVKKLPNHRKNGKPHITRLSNGRVLRCARRHLEGPDQRVAVIGIYRDS
jgi:hypothetical protein